MAAKSKTSGLPTKLKDDSEPSAENVLDILVCVVNGLGEEFTVRKFYNPITHTLTVQINNVRIDENKRLKPL